MSDLVGALVKALRPNLVIETGTATGETAYRIGEALAEGDYPAKLITYETDPGRADTARTRCHQWRDVVDVREQRSMDGIADITTAIHDGDLPPIGFAWLDSLIKLRVEELRAVLPLMSEGAVIGIHDCGQPHAAKYPKLSKDIALEARALGLSRISLPTPRGVTFLSRQRWW